MGPIAVGLILLVVLVLPSSASSCRGSRSPGPTRRSSSPGARASRSRTRRPAPSAPTCRARRSSWGPACSCCPVIQKLASIDLSARQISVSVGSAVSAQGIKCSLEGVAIVKVGGAEDSIRAAAQRFLGQQDHIEHFTQEVLAGSLRSIVGRLSVEEIVKDRAAFAREVAEEAETSLTNQGLVLDTFQLQDIQTEGRPPQGPRPAGGGPGREGGGDRRVDRPPGGGPGPHQGRGGDRRRRPRARPAQGGDPRRDRRRHGPGRGGRADRQGGQGPGGHRRPGAGRRAPGAAPRAPARHRGPQAGRRRALRRGDGGRGRPRRGRCARPRPSRPAGRPPPRRCGPRARPRRRRSSPAARPRRRRWQEGRRLRPVRRRRRARPAVDDAAQARQGGGRADGVDRQGHGDLHRGRVRPDEERRHQRHPGHAAGQRPAGHRPRRRCSSAWPTATARRSTPPPPPAARVTRFGPDIGRRCDRDPDRTRSADQQLGDLHGVEGGALAEVVAADEQGEAAAVARRRGRRAAGRRSSGRGRRPRAGSGCR